MYAQFVALTVRRHTHFSVSLSRLHSYFYKYLIWRTGAINEAGGKRQADEKEEETWLQGQGQGLSWDRPWDCCWPRHSNERAGGEGAEGVTTVCTDPGPRRRIVVRRNI